jgi:hypothetical protein
MMAFSRVSPSPCDLERAIQRELATLAIIEADYRSACRWLGEWCAPEAVKEGLACRLEARHGTEREAHVLRLAELHQRRMLLTMSRTGEHTDSFRAAQSSRGRPSGLDGLAS